MRWSGAMAHHDIMAPGRTADDLFRELRIGTLYAKSHPLFPWMFATWVEDQTDEQKKAGIFSIEFRPMDHLMGAAGEK